jgi:2-polyprenylphenol 6-hydroxylase
MTHFDVVIVGAGMVGLSLALSLAQKGFNICIVDQKALPLKGGEGDYDLRVSAITPATANFFKTLGCWEDILQKRVGTFERMFVYDKTGAIQFDAQDVGIAELGWIIENNLIQSVLSEKILKNPQITIKAPAAIDRFEQHDTKTEIHFHDNEINTADLIVAADGANSWVRQYFNVGMKSWSYEQSAIVATVQCSRADALCALQRFMPSGPLAFLPLGQDLFSIVWSLETSLAEKYMAEDDQAFCEKLVVCVGDHMGDIRLLSQRLCFPLLMRHIHHYVKKGLVFIGDAAHTIHPLAGQGANLGFADVITLTAVLLDAKKSHRSIGEYKILRAYERARKTKVTEMIIGMELFKQGFSQDNPILSSVRNNGLTWANKFVLFKRYMMKKAMGLF